ncbi:MAG: phospholipase A, partial [Thalassotalea sp.]|nr:phospholipase A [Thalassotalea sp.]
MKTTKNKNLLPILLCLVNAVSFVSFAEETSKFRECLYDEINISGKTKTLKELEAYCEKKMFTDIEGDNTELGLISTRLIKEQKTLSNPYVLTPHKMNYFLPATYSNDINTAPYKNYSNWGDNLDSTEAKFQISVKVPLNHGDLFIKGDKVYFGFTLESWWQVYNDDISRPFRETNYQPEGFYMAPLDWHPLGTNTGFILGFEHQSNGRSGLLSRSWNRVYANFLFEKENLALSFRPWWRIPEGNAVSSQNNSADDNPDITDYMGHFELSAVYKLNGKYEISAQVRENFSEHNGSIELGLTFPLWGKLRGYAQYFNGYGESLVDYNHSQQRIGI